MSIGSPLAGTGRLDVQIKDSTDSGGESNGNRPEGYTDTLQLKQH
jgi:hypothetical protein